MVKIDCFCGSVFLFCTDNIPEGQIYEAECPNCHAFLKRRKVSNNQPDETPYAVDAFAPNSPEIETTKCPACGKMNLRIGDFGIHDIKEEFRVVCDSCDFCSETQSGDYGEVFWAFLNDEYKKVVAEHSKKAEPKIIAWSKIPDDNVKISYSDGDTVIIKETIFNKYYYEIVAPEATKEFIKNRFANIDNLRIYNKLVRDKIPEIIEANGEYCKTEILNDDVAYLEALQRKLDEEIAEYHKDDTVEELADIIEVVYALVKAHGISKDYFEKILADKKDKKGGFDKRIMLKETYNVKV